MPTGSLGNRAVNQSADSGDDAVCGACRGGEDRRWATERVPLMDFDVAVAGCVEEVGGEAADTVGVHDVFVDTDRGGEHTGGGRPRRRRQGVGEAAEIAEPATLIRQSFEVRPH